MHQDDAYNSLNPKIRSRGSLEIKESSLRPPERSKAGKRAKLNETQRQCSDRSVPRLRPPGLRRKEQILWTAWTPDILPVLGASQGLADTALSLNHAEGHSMDSRGVCHEEKGRTTERQSYGGNIQADSVRLQVLGRSLHRSAGEGWRWRTSRSSQR